jgi:hypothetical protein
MSTTPPQSAKDGEDFLLRWERFPPPQPIDNTNAYPYKYSLLWHDGTSDGIRPPGKTLYTRPSGDTCSGREILLQFHKQHIPAFHKSDGTSRIDYSLNMFLVPDATRTTAQFQRAQGAWNIHQASYITFGSGIHDETSTNNLRNYGYFDWSGNPYDQQKFLLSGTTGRVDWNITKSMSQNHYDKTYEHESEDGDQFGVVMLYDTLGTADGTAISKNTGFLKLGKQSSNNVFTYYDLTGKYPPYYRATSGIADDFFQSDGNHHKYGSILNCVSDFACQLDSSSQSKRMFLKTSLPSVNGLIDRVVMEVYLSSSSDANKTLQTNIFISDNTSWTEGTVNNATLQAMRDSTTNTDFLPLTQGTCFIDDTGPVHYFGINGYVYHGNYSYWSPTSRTIRGADWQANINGKTSCTVIVEDRNRRETGTGFLTGSGSYKLGQDVFPNPSTDPPSKKIFYIDESFYYVAPAIHYAYLPPKMSLDTTSITTVVAAGGSPADDYIELTQIGWGELIATISSDSTWAIPSPSTSAALDRTDPAFYESDTITINYATNLLSVGDHTATITFFDADADETSLTAKVVITVLNNSYLVMDTTSITSQTIPAGTNADPVTVRVWDANDNTSDSVVYNIVADESWVSSIVDDTGTSNSSSNKQIHTVNFDMTALDPGTYTVNITATDISGYGSDSEQFTVNIEGHLAPGATYSNFML